MQLFSWLSKRMTGRPQNRRAPACRPAPRFRPQLEALEGRWVPSTLTVTNTLDSGHGSLRYDIAQAEKGSGKMTTIDFNIPKSDPGYNSSTGVWTITLLSGELDITKSLTIQGPGAGQLTISGGGAWRVFEVAPNVTAALSGLTISNGSANGPTNTTIQGGGIYNAGTLTVSNSTLSGNTAFNGIGDGRGGGIANVGTLTVSGSTLSNNSSDEGGGIANFFGTLTVSNSTLSGNSASQGGGIANEFATLHIVNSTLSGNTVNNNGGGVYSVGGYSTVSMTGCTLSGNSAASSGGGIYNQATLTVSGSSVLSGNVAHIASGGGILNFGTVTVSNSTLSGNSALIGGGGILNFGTLTVSGSTLSGNSAQYGGGIFNVGALTVSGSTLSGNSAQYGGGIDNGGALTVSASTLSGNTAAYYGGGIYNTANIGGAGTLTVSGCTLSGNTAAYGGGGIDNVGTLTVLDSVFSNNSPDNIFGPYTDKGGNTFS